MTETRNKIQKKSGEATRTKKPAAEKTPAKKRAGDDYDAFLESAEKAEKSAAGTGKRPAAPKKKASADDAKKQPSAARSKSAKPSGAKKEAGAREASGEKSSAAKRPAQKKAAVRSALLLVENDAYDDFLDAAELAQPKKKAPSKKKKSSGKKRAPKELGATLALLVMIVCVLGLAGWQYTRYENFMIMKAAVDRATFYEGTTVEGVDVSAMKLDEAIAYWETNIEPNYAQRKVTLSNGAEFSASELGYSSDYVTVLSNAWNAGRKGSLRDRYEALSFRKNQPASYNVTRVPYRAEAVEQCVSAIAEQIDRPAENSKIASFDMESYAFQFTDEVTGSKLDTQRLLQDMTAALDAGGGEVELVVGAIQPEIRKADIAAKYGMISSAVTNASSSSKNRLANIRLASQFINGTCLKPGETFSFNDIVGQRTTERGFKKATAYSSGRVVEDVGGGICQVSTTLFNAAVKADMKINERHNHSLTVGYVDKGKDAAVNWKSQDLRFTNTSDDNVYICCYVDSDKRVRFGIFGKLLKNGETISVEAKTTGKIDYETEYKANSSLPSGYAEVTQKGKQGYRAEAYKVRWDASGNRISSELLCKSTYKATKEIIEYGP